MKVSNEQLSNGDELDRNNVIEKISASRPGTLLH